MNYNLPFNARAALRKEQDRLATLRKQSGTRALRAYLVPPARRPSIIIYGKTLCVKTREDVISALQSFGLPHEAGEEMAVEVFAWRVYTVPHFQLQLFYDEKAARQWADDLGLPVTVTRWTAIYEQEAVLQLAADNRFKREREREQEQQKQEQQKQLATVIKQADTAKRTATAANQTATQAVKQAESAHNAADDARVTATRALNRADDANELAADIDKLTDYLRQLSQSVDSHGETLDQLTGYVSPEEKREACINMYMRAGRTRAEAEERYNQMLKFIEERNAKSDNF